MTRTYAGGIVGICGGVIAVAQITTTAAEDAAYRVLAANLKPPPELRAGSELKKKLDALPSSTAMNLGRFEYTDTGGHGNAFKWTDYSGMRYAPSLRAMIGLGGGHASTDFDAVVAYRIEDMKWRELYPATPAKYMVPSNQDRERGLWLNGPAGPYPRPVARHTEDQQVIVNGELIVLALVEGNGPVAGANWPKYTSYEYTSSAVPAHLNLQTMTWTFAPKSSVVASAWNAAELDPKTGKIFLLSWTGLRMYDPIARHGSVAVDVLSFPGASQLIDESGNRLPAGELSYNRTMVYYPENGHFYYFVLATGSVFEVRLNRSDVSKTIIQRIMHNAPRATGEAQDHFAYDSVNKLMVGGLKDGVMHAFDPATRKWHTQKVNTNDGSPPPKAIAFQAMDYSPPENAIIFVTPWQTDGGRTFAYRWK